MNREYIGNSMNILHLIEWLNYKVNEEEIISSLRPEVLEYVKSIKIKGGASNINITGNFQDLVFTSKNLETLLSLYLNNKLLEWDLEYILNAIELSGIKYDKRVEEVIFNLSTHEINVPINMNTVGTCMKYLKGEAEAINYKPNKKEVNNYHSIFL